MADTAKDAQALAKAYQVVAHSLSIGITAATRLLDSLMKNKDTQELAQTILKIANDPDHNEKDFMVSRNLHPEVIPALSDILNREDNLAANIINADPNDRNTKNSIIYFDCQKQQINMALSEALARSGLMKEIDRNIADNYISKLTDNPMFEMKNLPVEKYEMLVQDISKLDFPLNRITLFPKYYEHNGEQKVDVGFLGTIPEKQVKGSQGKIKTVGPYSIPNIAKGLLVKQQLLENAKEGEDYEKFMTTKNDYRKSIQENYLNIEGIRSKWSNVSGIYERIKRLDIDDKEKEMLVDMLKRSSISSSARDQFIGKLNELEIDQSSKDLITKKMTDLKEVRYLVPATINFENDKPEYTLDRNYIAIGASVTAHIDNKDINVDLNKAKDEIDYFMKTNMNLDDRTILVLNQQELDRYLGKKKLFKNKIDFTKNNEEKISFAYQSIKGIEEPSNRVIQTFNENKAYFEVSTKGMDILDIEAEKNSPEFVKDLLLDNKEKASGDLANAEIIEAAFEDVEAKYTFYEVSDNKGLDRIIEDIEQEPIHSDDRDHYSFDRSHDQPLEDDYFDRDHDGQDDRDQFR